MHVPSMTSFVWANHKLQYVSCSTYTKRLDAFLSRVSTVSKLLKLHWTGCKSVIILPLTPPAFLDLLCRTVSSLNLKSVAFGYKNFEATWLPKVWLVLITWLWCGNYTRAYLFSREQRGKRINNNSSISFYSQEAPWFQKQARENMYK